MSKIIIGIHGLGAKPLKPILREEYLGYMRTPELAEIVHSFLAYKKFNLFRWFKGPG